MLRVLYLINVSQIFRAVWKTYILSIILDKVIFLSENHQLIGLNNIIVLTLLGIRISSFNVNLVTLEEMEIKNRLPFLI